MEVKLTIGCGKDVLDEWENYDLFPIDDRVKKLDLNVLPLPFKENFADYILLSHVFEHLVVNRYDLMREIHRILKIDGIVEIRVPSSSRCLDHTMWFFPKHYFDMICNKDINKSYQTYCNFFFEQISVERIARDKYSKLFDAFPALEKLFPFMCNSELVWKLKKVLINY